MCTEKIASRRAALMQERAIIEARWRRLALYQASAVERFGDMRRNVAACVAATGAPGSDQV